MLRRVDAPGNLLGTRVVADRVAVIVAQVTAAARSLEGIVTSTAGAGRSPLPSIAVGVVAAVVGAVLWAVLVDVTNYKVGYAAVGLGLLVGLAMARTAPAWRPLPAVAALVAVGGCLLGDLVVDATALGQVTGAGTLSALTDMASDPGLGRDVFSAGFEAMDVVFWVIAAVAAFRLTNRAVSAATARATTPDTPAAPFMPAGPATP